VLCHELAHWKRRDHWSSLIAELIIALLPVQPLAWWARRRLAHLCERACDDWVLASGQSPVHYAESLLGLLPQKRPALTLAAVRSRKGLRRRLRHILDRGASSPVIGRRWAMTATLATALLAVGIALAQERPVAAEEPAKLQAVVDMEISLGLERRAPEAQAPARLTVAGRVLSHDGKPVINASVALVAGGPVTGKTKTDKDGKFKLNGSYSPSEPALVMAVAPGFGPAWLPLQTDPKNANVTLYQDKGDGKLTEIKPDAKNADVAIRLPPEQVI